MENKEVLKKLCCLYIEQQKKANKINELFEGNFDLVGDLENIILDLFGFKKDNTLECFDFNKQKYINGKTEKDIFCRDILLDIFFNAENGESLYKTLLDEKGNDFMYGLPTININF